MGEEEEEEETIQISSVPFSVSVSLSRALSSIL